MSESFKTIVRARIAAEVSKFRMTRAAIALREGSPAPAVDNPGLYRQRSGGVMLPKDADWIESTKKLREAFVRHTELVGD